MARGASDRSAPAPEETIASIKAQGAEAFAFAGDITNEAIVEEFARRNIKRGAKEALVNNAGISFIAPAESVSAADYRCVSVGSEPGCTVSASEGF